MTPHETDTCPYTKPPSGNVSRQVFHHDLAQIPRFKKESAAPRQSQRKSAGLASSGASRRGTAGARGRSRPQGHTGHGLKTALNSPEHRFSAQPPDGNGVGRAPTTRACGTHSTCQEDPGQLKQSWLCRHRGRSGNTRLSGAGCPESATDGRRTERSVCYVSRAIRICPASPRQQEKTSPR